MKTLLFRFGKLQQDFACPAYQKVVRMRSLQTADLATVQGGEGKGEGGNVHMTQLR